MENQKESIKENKPIPKIRLKKIADYFEMLSKLPEDVFYRDLPEISPGGRISINVSPSFFNKQFAVMSSNALPIKSIKSKHDKEVFKLLEKIKTSSANRNVVSEWIRNQGLSKKTSVDFLLINSRWRDARIAECTGASKAFVSQRRNFRKVK